MSPILKTLDGQPVSEVVEYSQATGLVCVRLFGEYSTQWFDTDELLLTNPSAQPA